MDVSIQGLSNAPGIAALRAWHLEQARKNADWLRRMAIIRDRQGDCDVASVRRRAMLYWLAYEPGFYNVSEEQA